MDQHLAKRAQALTLHGAGISFAVIKEKTGYSKSGFYELRRRAISRGYVDGGPVLDQHVREDKRTGRPPKVTSELEAEILASVAKRRIARGRSAAQVASEVNEGRPAEEAISRRTVLRVLRRKKGGGGAAAAAAGGSSNASNNKTAKRQSAHQQKNSSSSSSSNNNKSDGVAAAAATACDVSMQGSGGGVTNGFGQLAELMNY